MNKLNFKQLNTINANLIDHFDLVQKYFDLHLFEQEAMYMGACPLHGGADNPTAFNLYKNTGVWACRTHGCEQIFKSTTIGLIRGLLSKHKLGWDGDRHTKIVSFPETLKFIEEFSNTLPNKQMYSAPKQIAQPTKGVELNLPIRVYMEGVECPAQYYLDRGFSEKVLEEYKVGYYFAPGKEMHNRVIVPLFNDEKTRIIGCTGRIIYDKCIVCEGFHSSDDLCADRLKEPWKFQKWKHNKGLIKSNYLYNWWDARCFIKNKKEIILVEGPSEVWKLEECGVHNSMAIFGSNLSLAQQEKIKSLDIENIKIIVDNDEAGHKVFQKVEKALPDFKIEKLVPPSNDLGDLEHDEVLELIA